jgi:hypothetical protein
MNHDTPARLDDPRPCIGCRHDRRSCMDIDTNCPRFEAWAATGASDARLEAQPMDQRVAHVIAAEFLRSRTDERVARNGGFNRELNRRIDSNQDRVGSRRPMYA